MNQPSREPTVVTGGSPVTTEPLQMVQLPTADARQASRLSLRARIAARVLISLALLSLIAASVRAQGGAVPETPVGVAGHRNQVVITGPEIEVVPLEDRKSPVRLRIVAVFPHGNAFRY